jgi:hypothetical protein
MGVDRNRHRHRGVQRVAAVDRRFDRSAVGAVARQKKAAPGRNRGLLGGVAYWGDRRREMLRAFCETTTNTPCSIDFSWLEEEA